LDILFRGRRSIRLDAVCNGIISPIRLRGIALILLKFQWRSESGTEALVGTEMANIKHMAIIGHISPLPKPRGAREKPIKSMSWNYPQTWHGLCS
jgi:hypothetical protein